jgi:pimeloyl-ACP methyl ester carboxylesterase
MPRIDVPGGVIEVTQIGQGADLVLLHSLLTDKDAFAPILPALTKQHRVTLVDLPGFGGSTPAEPRIEDFADRVAGIFPELGLAPTGAVMGNGFGAFVAVALAQRHGGLFDRLIVCDGGAAFPDAGRTAFRLMAEKALSGGMAAIVDIAVNRIFHPAYLEAHPSAIAERRAVLLKNEPRAFAAACRALEIMDLRPGLGTLRKQLLVIVGTLDTATPPPLGRELAAGVAGARFVEIADCGHCPPLEAPDRLLALIQPFLADRPA